VGFTGATWHRGIPVVQAPTTLLAMADSALGGKTAVDLPAGKNLVGTFHAPSAVYADIATLASLPDSGFRAGFAEVVKTAVVADDGLFRWLEASAQALLRRDDAALEHAIGACLALKGRVVARDERETGRRAILNFGHTVAHALEAASGYAVPHGHAVAVGMVVEAHLAARTGSFPRAHLRRLERLLAALGLPARWPEGVSVDDVVAAARKDKKVRGGELRFALPRRIGRMRPGDDVTVPVGESLVGEILEGLRHADAPPASG
jgi:3-dehydroquinate synthase